MGSVDFEDGASFVDKIVVVLYMLLNPYIIVSIVLTFMAGVAWMMAMTKFEISYAYPFTSLGFVLILLFSALLLGESMTWPKVVGSIFIAIGIIISSKSL
jgi:drug/metabolite transporter (DMT)-like permease